MIFSDFNLLQAYALRGIELYQLHERLSSLEEEIARLKEMIKAQQDALFGKKSEASKSRPGCRKNPRRYPGNTAMLTTT